jgi:NAD(P)-dependent dehydrogenase (short-subunit alcohol dehydrogenase family)
VEKFGGVDFLINLACVHVDDALNATRKDWLDSYNINVVAGVMMLKAVKPHMVKRVAAPWSTLAASARR